MSFLGDLLYAGTQGASAYAQTKDQMDQRERQQKIDDEDREAYKRTRGLEAALLALELEKKADGPEQRYNVRDGRVVPEGGYTSRDEAVIAAEAQRADMRRTDLRDRNREVDQARRLAEARAAGTAAGTPAEPRGGMARPPAEVQKAISEVPTALSSMDQYAQAVQRYMSTGRGSRLGGMAGVPNAERDAAIGEIQSLQSAVLFAVKNLAGLGVLSGPDERLVMQMIGDPLSRESTLRDPAYISAQLDRARSFIEDRARAYEQQYGVRLLGDAGRGLDRAATPSDFSTLSDEEILDRIMRGPGG